jgi:PiT family inorganic phosphate transporter
VIELLTGVLVLGLVFAFANGFHDMGVVVGNAVATRALRPGPAVTLATGFTVVGALLGQGIADAVTDALLHFSEDPRTILLTMLAGLSAALLINVATYLMAVPVSSTHCLFGGLAGAAVIFGFTGPDRASLLAVGLPLLLAPVIAWLCSLLVTRVVLQVVRARPAKPLLRVFRMASSVGVALLSLVHGVQDAQKIGAVLFFAWGAVHALPGGAGLGAQRPLWLLLAVACALGLGTATGGWRVARTVSMRMVSLEPVRGAVAGLVASAVLYVSTFVFRAPFSTAWSVVGANLGTQIGARPNRVHLELALKVGSTWLLTLVVAAGLGCLLAWPLSGLV